METPAIHKGFILLAWSLLFLVAAFPLGTVAEAQSPEAPYDEAEAQSIDRSLMCPVCPAETIDQAQVPISRQMRQLVRQMLSQGASRQEILDHFADRYGPNILASPPKTGINLVAWIFPIVGVAAVLAAGLLTLRSMSARKVAPAASHQPTEDELAPYLEMVDLEIARLQNPRVTRRSPEPGPANDASRPNSSDSTGNPVAPGESDSTPHDVGSHDVGPHGIERGIESHREGGLSNRG